MTKEVLVADDDLNQRAILKDMLRGRYGARVSEVKNSEALIAYTQFRTYDLIITDNRMPNKDDGIKAIEVIRHPSHHSGYTANFMAPIVLRSGDDVGQFAAKEWCVDFLPKSARAEEVYAILDKYLK